MSLEQYEMLLVFFGVMGVLFAGTKIGLALLNRDRGVGASSGRSLSDLAREVAALRQAVEVTSVEVERIGEGQRFLTKVLNEGSGATGSGDDRA